MLKTASVISLATITVPLITIAAPPRGYSIPLVDLADDHTRQTVVDREPGQYLGHPSTQLLEDGRTILCVYPKGHGRGAIVYKQSRDGGQTWSDRLPTPQNWESSKEVPTIHRVVDADGTKRLIMWSGLYPARLAVSEDDGRTWSDLKPAGDWGGIVVMGSVVPIATGDGHYLAMFHDDGRFFRKDGSRANPVEFTLYQTRSTDGGLTWGEPESIWHGTEVHLCEPGIIRSPDGTQLAALLRENSRTRNSYVIFSDDEGRSWSEPRELPGSLTGDRHTGKYAPDGRLFISFRDTTHESPTKGDWVGWVGTYEDIAEGREGQYRVRLMDNHVRADCAYPGVEILPDGTFVCTTYGHWTEGEQPYIVSVRFTLDELDGILSRQPRVLLIGDSISMGYSQPVRHLLAGEMRVSRIPMNGGDTWKGLANIESWLGDEPWDVIHFNWGLHDLCYRVGGRGRDKVNGILSTTLEQYEENLTKLVERLEETGASLIWATTTPVPEGEPGRFAGADLEYNEVAERIMRARGIPINDLNAAVDPHRAIYLPRPGDVHFSKQGSAFLAEHVATSIRENVQARQPNIIVFLVDDMGWQDTSVPFHEQVTPFNERYQTPNMERLAARGVRFTNAYASAPVCTPTRTSILTGMSPGRSHVTFWILHKDRDTSRNHDLIHPPAWNVNGLGQDDVTLPRLLQNVGYRTIHVGKAHFGAHGTSGSDPRHLGFDANIAGHASGAPGSYYGIHHFANEKREGGSTRSTVWDVPGLEQYHGQDIYLTEALADEATRELSAAIDSNEPFFLYFAPYAVHTPIMPNKRYLEHYADLDAKEAAYATMIETMDAALGDILDLLDERRIADDTVIIFSSDNGGLSAHARGGEAHTHNAPLNSGKGSAYEGGVRVPTIIAMPGQTDSGGRCDVPVISHDFFPTILSIAGARVPDCHRPLVDGRDLTPLITGGGSLDMDRALFWHQPHVWGARGPGIWPFTSVRRGNWKLIYFHAGRRFELFNLEDDLGETTNLAADVPDRVVELAEFMSQWIEEAGVQLSIDRATGQPIALPRDALQLQPR